MRRCSRPAELVAFRCRTQIRLWGFQFDGGGLLWCSNGPAAESGERYLGYVGIRMFLPRLGFTLLFLLAADCRAGELIVAQCSKTDAAPLIDGSLEDKAWVRPGWMTGFFVLGTRDRAAKQTSVSVCHDGERLYVAARLSEPQPESLQKEHAKRDADLWEDDCFEVFVVGNDERRTVYHFIVNANGALYDAKGGHRRWNADVAVACGKGQEHWTVELGIPFSDLDVAEPSGKAFAVNWCRQDKVSAVLSSWSPLQARFLEPERFGVLLIDTDVSALTEQHLEALRVSAPAPEPNDLVANGSFELLVSGIVGDYPRHWAEQRWTHEDRLEVVSDPRGAHWGRRYLRLSAPGDAEIRVHSTSREPIELQPGSSYTLRAWARKEPGTGEATLFIEPGKGKAKLTDEWKQYTCTYSHPSDAGAVETGMYIGILGGPAAVDDVSAVQGDADPQVAAELKVQRSGIKALRTSRDWRRVRGEPLWEQRAEIAVSEVMGVNVSAALVDMEIQDIFPGRFTYRYFNGKRLKVVDAASAAGGKEVPWALVSLTESNERVVKGKGRFSIVFLASLPARSTKTYHVYLAAEAEGEQEVEYLDDVPEQLERSASYPHQLDWWREGVEKRVDITCKETGGIVRARVRGWTASGASAELVCPDGNQKIPLPLGAVKPEGNLWLSPADYRLPEGSAEGIWKLAVTLEDRSGRTERIDASFVHGSTLWWDSNVAQIYRDDPPRYGRDYEVVLHAARNEHEAFQVAIDTEQGLRGVELSVTDAVHESGAAIGAERFTVQRIREVYLAAPPRGRSGWYPDALLPFRKCDIEAGTRRLAWIAVSVPKGVAAGVYRGRIVAAGAGRTLELPLKLTVFDFELPDVASFKALMGADVSGGRAGRTRTRWFGGDESRYRSISYHPHYLWKDPRPDYTAILSLARMLAERRMGLHYYWSTWANAYPAPWRYDASRKSADFDFRMFDHNLGILLDELNVSCVTLAARNRTGASSAGWIGDGGPWLETRSATYRKQNVALALDMDRAWARGMAAHLRDKGWLERVFVYATDEPVPSNLKATARYCRSLKEGDPAIKTFGAGYGQYGWAPYFDDLDAFGSAYAIKVNLRKQLAQRGVAYWGVYNRMGHIADPLAKARIIGMDSWNRGCMGFFEHAVAGRQAHDLMLNPKVYRYHDSGPPEYPPQTFIREASPSSYLFVYPWPEDEPLPDTKTPRSDALLIRPVSAGPGDVSFVPAGRDRPFASTLRLEAMREAIDDYEYLQMLQRAAQGAPAQSESRQRFESLRARLDALLKQANLDTHHSGSPESSIFVVNSDALQRLRRDIGRAVESAMEQ